METQNRVQLIVGGFLLFGLVAIMTTIFMLGADRALFKNYVRLHAYFDQVQGLDRGSVVSLSGVAVGNIESIEFVNDKKSLDVTMKIEDRFLSRIPTGSQVEIRTQGALGDKFVFIIPGPASEKPVNDGAILEVATATDLFAIISERSKDAGKVFDIINELHKSTLTINGDRKLEKIMQNLSKATESLALTSQQAQQFTGSLSQADTGQRLTKAVERFDSIMTKIDKGQGSLGALINDPSVHDRLKTLLGGNVRKSQVKDLMRNSIEKAGGSQ